MAKRGTIIYAEAARRVVRQWPRHLATHIAAAAIGTVLLWPLLAFGMQRAVALSGSAALADLAIARFLLSPAGLIAMLAVGGALIAVLVFETACMMAIDMAERRDAVAGPVPALRFIARKMPDIVKFGVVLLIRILVMLLPLLGIGALTASVFLSSHDINYYLAEKPPEFWTAIVIIGLTALVTALWGLSRILQWSLALPLTLFGREKPLAAFRRSAHMVRSRKPGVAWALLVWALAASLLTAVAGAVLYAIGDIVIPEVDASLRHQAIALGIAACLWLLVQTLVQTFINASFALTLNAVAVAATPEAMTEAEAPSGHRKRGQAILPGWVVMGVAGIVLLAVSVAALTGTVRRLDTTETVEVIAHRAGAGKAPENTMAAVKLAIEDGAGWLEIDVQESADGTVIVMHDRDFMRQAGDPLMVHDAGPDDLARLDIGNWFGLDFEGERVATLDEVLAAAKGRTKVLIELKYYGFQDRLEERVAESVERLAMTDSIAAMSLDWEGAKRMREVRPDWQIGLLSARAIGDLTEIGADFLAVNAGMVNARLLRRAHAAGQSVYVWTINDRSQMSDMISRGVDGLITDYPAEAREVIAERAALSPAHKLMLLAGSRMGLTD